MTSEVETIRRDATALEASQTMLCHGVNRRGFGCVFAALGSSVQMQLIPRTPRARMAGDYETSG
jgi:hypothetical protein